MAKSPPSSSTNKKTLVSGKDGEDANGGDNTLLKVNGSGSGGSATRSRETPRSPSGISLSRPRSLLSPSRPSPSTPLMNAASTPSMLSASPSSRSIVDRNATGSGVASSLRVGESSAMGRLRRVASNASIASSMRVRVTPSAAAQDKVVEEQKSEQDKSSQQHEVDSAQQHEVDSAQHPAQQDEGSSTTANKRLLESESNDTKMNKHARRRTWFGFMSGDAEYDEDAKTITTAEVNKDDVTMQDARTEEDGQSTVHDAFKERPKSWLPWRAPSAAADEVNQNQDRPTELRESYTDSVRRYISWAAQSGAELSSPNARWGWPTWRSASTPIPQHDSNANGQLQTDNGTAKVSFHSSDTNNPFPDAQPNVDSAVELDVSKRNGYPAEGVLPAPTAESSPAQGSFITRWMPTWGRSSPYVGEDSQRSSENENEQQDANQPKQPTTPAERYKAEALAHLGAKNAILNNSTRSTWIDYFGSRSAALRPKVNNDDIDEPEVMRIEASAPSSSSAKKQLKKASVQTGARGSGTSTPADVRSIAKTDGTAAGTDTLKTPIADPAPAKSRPATPLTKEKDVAQQVVSAAAKSDEVRRKGSGTLKGSGKAAKEPVPNLLLPSFNDTFSAPPRSHSLKTGVWEKTMSLFFNSSASQSAKTSPIPSSAFSQAPKSIANGRPGELQARLPRSWDVLGEKDKINSRGCKGIRKVTVIGIHGWFSQGPIRNLFGEPTGTSTRFAGLMMEAVKKQFDEAGMPLNDEQISVIPLQGDGLVSERVDKSFAALLGNAKWVDDLRTSDAIFVAAHSQGSIVATHLLARLVEQRHLNPLRTRVVLLCMCGIHNGPFAHLRGSISSYYMNTFETPAARELFEFQNGQSPVSRLYAASLRIVCAAGIKLVYVASLDDQVVPLFSALHTSASHPSILRAVFCDGAAFPRVDFLTNLLSFCVQVRNAGLWDHHLVTLLSSSVAGSLYGGLGHSIVYDELQVYSLAARYLLEVSSPGAYPTARPGETKDNGVAQSQVPNLPPGVPALELDDEITLARNQKWNANPYALPWSLRGLLEDEQVRHYFSAQIEKLVGDYVEWQPQTKTLKDVQFRLEPIRLIAGAPQRAKTSSTTTSQTPSTSKL